MDFQQIVSPVMTDFELGAVCHRMRCPTAHSRAAELRHKKGQRPPQRVRARGTVSAVMNICGRKNGRI